MGGKGSGGARRGSGPKPKTLIERSVTGVRARGTVLAHPSSTPIVAPVDEADAPDTLTIEERHIWLEYAPEAYKKRTLNESTMGAFVVMCRTIALERDIARGRDAGTTNHRGWTAEVRKQMATFDLWPNGKAIYEAEAEKRPADPLAKFRRANG